MHKRIYTALDIKEYIC